MSLPAGVRLYVSGPTGGSMTDYSSLDGLGLVVSDETPGGYADASFTICNPNNNLPELFSKVWIYDETNQATIWLGRVDTVEAELPNGPAVIRCRGYQDALTDQRFAQSRVFDRGSDIVNIIADAVAELCPDIPGPAFDATGIGLAEDTANFALQTALDVINAMIALTSGFATPLVFHVRESPLAPTTPRLVLSFQDVAIRYRASLVPNLLTCKQSFDGKAIVNRSTAQWGNQQFRTVPGNEPIDYTHIKIIRDKAINAENDIRVLYIADNLARALLERFKLLRSVNDSLTVCEGAKIAAVPPAFSIVTDDIPHRLFKTGYSLYLSNIDSKYRPYHAHNTKYITRAEYNFDTQVLTLTGGELIGLGTAIRNLSSTVTTREHLATASSAFSTALVDNDQLPTFGPQFPGLSTEQPPFTGGVPVFTKNEGAKFDAYVHPYLIADFGLEANITIGNLTAGPKGGIKTTPGLYSSWDAYFDNDDQADTITIKLFKKARLPDDSPLQSITDIRIIGHTHAVGTFGPINMADGDRFFFEVTEEPTTAEVCSISIKGPKQFPGIRL